MSATVCQFSFSPKSAVEVMLVLSETLECCLQWMLVLIET